MSDGKVLECLLCAERYSRADVAAGLYRMETFICSLCYERMQTAPYDVSCFGKPTFEGLRRQLGYDLKAQECCELCPDRKVCRLLFIEV